MKVELVPPVPSEPTYKVTLTASEVRALRAVAGYAGFVEMRLQELYGTRTDVDTSCIKPTLLAFWSATRKLVEKKEI